MTSSGGRDILHGIMCLAIPIQITELLGDERAAGTQLGVRVEFSTAVLDNPQPGDHVLVHAGMAIQKLDDDEALETLEIWKALQEAE